MERYRVDMRTFITRLEMTIQKDLDTELNIHMKGKELNMNDIISFFFYILLIYQIFFFKYRLLLALFALFFFISIYDSNEKSCKGGSKWKKYQIIETSRDREKEKRGIIANNAKYSYDPRDSIYVGGAGLHAYWHAME